MRDIRKFVARLTGSQEVPPVRTIATGDAHFRLSKDGSRLFFRLVVRNIRKVTQAHIHLGRIGQNGPIVGKSLSAMIKEIRSGNTYVNVHTNQNPNGEIRGQIS